MTKSLRILAAVLTATAPGIAAAGGWSCRLTQDCDLGSACIDLNPTQEAWITDRGEGRLDLEMSGQVSAFAEIARFDNSASFAGSPTRNNVLLLTIHGGGAVALTVHYSTAADVHSNTLRGTCVAEAG